MDRRPGSDDMLAEYEQDRRDAAADAEEEGTCPDPRCACGGTEEHDEEDDEDAPQSARGPDGKLRVLTERCGTCIFRPGNLMRLNPGRLREMTEESVAQGSYITCHDTLTYGANPDFGPAVCRGFYDAHGYRSNLVRIMQRLGGITEVAPPQKEDSRA